MNSNFIFQNYSKSILSRTKTRTVLKFVSNSDQSYGDTFPNFSQEFFSIVKCKKCVFLEMIIVPFENLPSSKKYNKNWKYLSISYFVCLKFYENSKTDIIFVLALIVFFFYFYSFKKKTEITENRNFLKK